MKTLYLCAVGNGEGIRLALTINRAERRWERIVLLDDDEKKHGTIRLGLEVAGPFSLLAEADPASSEVVNLVTRTTGGRDGARAKIGGYGIPFASLVHPSVDLFSAEIGNEVTLYQNASIGAESRVGDSTVVLIGAVVGHGARVGRCCVIAPNAVINARVRVGDLVYVGSNASILPDVSIGEGATVAANSVVFSDVPAGATAIGVPANIISMPGSGAASEAGNPPLSPSTPLRVSESRPASASSDGADWAGDGELERNIAGILREILGVSDVGMTGNFFELGCNSLKALQLWKRIQGELGRELSVLDIYRFPTARSLASFLERGTGTGALMQQAQQRATLRRQTRQGQTKRP